MQTLELNVVPVTHNFFMVMLDEYMVFLVLSYSEETNKHEISIIKHNDEIYCKMIETY